MQRSETRHGSRAAKLSAVCAENQVAELDGVGNGIGDVAPDGFPLPPSMC